MGRGVPRVGAVLVLALVVACSGGDGASSNISIVQPVPTRVDVSPASAALLVGGSQLLAATVYDQNGATMFGQAVSWSSSNVSVASVANSGLVTATGAGTASISASVGSVNGSAIVAVTTPPVATVTRVALNPSTASVAVGATTTLTPTAYDAQNNVITGRSASFSTASASIATVSSSGVVTGVAAGTTTVSATIDGVSGDATVTVTPSQSGAVARVTLSPSQASVVIGTTVTLTPAAFDAQNNVVTGKTATFTSSAPAIATVSTIGVVSGVAAGTVTVSAVIDGVQGDATVVVLTLPVGNTIDINPGQTFQTIVGWEGTGSIGEVECNQTAFQNYKVPVMNRLGNELGLNRVRLQVRSGYESPVDYFVQYRNGQIDYATWQATWYTPVNDNSDPNVTDATKFQWGWLDYQIDEVVLPLMQRLQARGEKLYVNLNYIDFKQGKVKSFIQIKQPAEYAEFIAAAFQHIKQKYGWSPDALEILLEPSNAGDLNTGVYGPDLGNAIVAAGNKLASLGFHPDVIAPSDASMGNSITLYDDMIKVPGVFQYLKELSYHRYQNVSLANLQAIAFRGQRDNVRTAMLEWNQGVSIETLLEDLTVGNVSAWQQFSMAYCDNSTNRDRTGIYYQINQSNPLSPVVTMTNNARDYRQVFDYVRAGAVRIAAVSGNASVLATVAFRNADGRYVAVVRAQAAAAFAVRGLPAGTYGVNYGVQVPYNVDLPDVVIATGGSATVSIPAKGVITLYQR